MARIADVEMRRREVCEATWKVVARDGLEKASLRAIAFELGMSTGVLMHYFKNKEDLLLFAIDQLMARLEKRQLKVVEGVTGWQRLAEYLLGSLPIEPKSQIGWQVWLAYAGSTIGRSDLLKVHAERYAINRIRLASEIKALQEAGQIRAEVDATEEADNLVELVDGIGLGWLIDPQRYSAERQTQKVYAYIDHLRCK